MPSVSFPHPVLGNGDDVAIGSIACELTYRTSEEAVELIFTGLTTANPSIDDAVAQGRAAWLLRVQCARTYYRNVWREPGPGAQLLIPGPDLEGTVEVEVRICATRPMIWQPEGVHQDYGGLAFKLDAGDVIALGPSWRFPVDKEFDPLKAPIASWMRIVEGSHEDGPFQVDFDDEVVVIRLSKLDWTHWPGVRDRVPATVHSSIVLPVLMRALTLLKIDDGVRWKARLQAVMDNRGLSADNPLETAQILLDSPFGRCLRETNLKLDGDDS